MGDIVIFYIIQHILVFGIIFWVLTYLGEYFYSSKQHEMKKQFYECGFKALSDLNIQINVNFILMCVFLILYDIEFILLFSFLFNITEIMLFQFLVFIFFILFIVLSLLYDIQKNALNWYF